MSRLQNIYRASVNNFDFLKFSLVVFFFLFFANAWHQCSTLMLYSSSNHEQVSRFTYTSDFIIHWVSTQFVADGRPVAMYEPSAFVPKFYEYYNAYYESQNIGRTPSDPVVNKLSPPVRTAPEYKGAFVYPPVFAMYFAPLAFFSPEDSYLIFMWTGVALYALAIILWLVFGGMTTPAAAALIAAPVVGVTVLAGQNGLLLAGLIGTGFALLYRAPVLAGVCFGLACFKPQYGLLLPLLFLVGGCYQTFASAALTVLALLGATVFVLGPEIWSAFFTYAPSSMSNIMESPFLWSRMYSVTAMILELTGSHSFASYVQIASALTATFLAVAVWRRTSSLALRSASAIFATYLSIPLAYDYDSALLVFGIAAFYHYRIESKWTILAVPISFMLYFLPTFYVPFGFSIDTHFLIAPLLIWSLLVLTFLLSREEKASHTTLAGFGSGEAVRSVSGGGAVQLPETRQKTNLSFASTGKQAT